MNLIKILTLTVLLWGCEKSKSTNQYESISQENKIETDSSKKMIEEQRYKEVLQSCIDIDSVKINDIRAFGVSKKYLVKKFGKPDSIKNNLNDPHSSVMFESLYWGKSSYAVYSVDVIDLSTECFDIENINLDEGYKVEINGFLISENTTLKDLINYFPNIHKANLQNEQYKKELNQANKYFVFGTQTKFGKIVADAYLKIILKDGKVTNIEFFVDNS